MFCSPAPVAKQETAVVDDGSKAVKFADKMKMLMLYVPMEKGDLNYQDVFGHVEELKIPIEEHISSCDLIVSMSDHEGLPKS